MTSYNPRICTVCGKSYMPTSPRQKVCSRVECKTVLRRRAENLRYDRIERKRLKKLCPACGKEFTTSDSKRKYCGNEECEHERNRRNNKRSNLRNRAKLREDAKFRRREREREKYQTMVSSFGAFGYKVLDDKYNGNAYPVEVVCPQGHLWKVSYHAFKDAGTRCLQCYLNEKIRDFSQTNAYIESLGYTWLNGKPGSYYQLDDQIRYRCPIGHVFQVQLRTLLGGSRCRECFADKIRRDYEEIAAEFKEANYTLLSDKYENNKLPLSVLCDKGHIFEISYSAFHSGGRCNVCYPHVGTSKAEIELRDFIATLVGEDKVIANTLDVIGPQEVDVYVPSKGFGLEYTGLYWHSDKFKSDRFYHIDKTKACKEKSVWLFTVFEDEYKNQPEVVKSRIASALGCIETKIYARKCELRQIDKTLCRDFLKENHLQGSAPTTVCWGLFLDGDLVQVLSLGPFARSHVGSANMIELKRLASKKWINVVGGASKLFSAAKKFCKQNGYTAIKSFCDMRYGNPFTSIYDILGFELLHEASEPTKHYVLRDKRFRSQTLALTMKERKLGLTESELREIQGYGSIWDCGNRTYLYELR